MKKNDLEWILFKLDSGNKKARFAMENSTKLDDKLKFHRLEKALQKTRNSLIKYILDFEDCLMVEELNI